MKQTTHFSKPNSVPFPPREESLNFTRLLALGFPGGASLKYLSANTGDAGSIPGSGKPPGGAKANLFQYSCQENPLNRQVRWATVQRVAKSQTRLSN